MLKSRITRRHFLIDKSFQFRFCFYVCSWVVALSLIYPFLIREVFDFFIRYLAADPRGPEVSALFEARNEIMRSIIYLELTWLVTIIAISIFMSHRIVGPLYKLRIFFAEAKAGDISKDLYFRSSDYFQNVAHDYNGMMKELRKRVLSGDQTQKLNTSLETAHTLCAQKELSPAQILKLRETIENVQNLLKDFGNTINSR